eukprot:scaffold2214_cov139-Cylindrotheca_fusiformis.AAC.34
MTLSKAGCLVAKQSGFNMGPGCHSLLWGLGANRMKKFHHRASPMEFGVLLRGNLDAALQI